MPRHYPAELRRRTCERMLAGEAVKDLSAELGIHSVTLLQMAAPGVDRRRTETGPKELRGGSAPRRPPAGQRARGRAQGREVGQ